MASSSGRLAAARLALTGPTVLPEGDSVRLNNDLSAGPEAYGCPSLQRAGKDFRRPPFWKDGVGRGCRKAGAEIVTRTSKRELQARRRRKEGAEAGKASHGGGWEEEADGPIFG